MKICFLTIKSPEDKTSWSGIYYHMYTNLKKYHEVKWIGAVKFNKLQNLILRLEYIYYKHIRHKSLTHKILFSLFYARNVKKLLATENFDILYAPASSELISFLDTDIPIVYLSDTTFQLMVDYYPEYKNLTKKRIKEGNEIEKNAIQKATRVIFSSDWAKNSAIDFYHVSQEKVSVFELGANLLYEPKIDDLDFSSKEVCNILFLGVDWIRKGGDTAYKTYLRLKNKGFLCTLTIIGCNPALGYADDDIIIIPFLNKNDDGDFARLYKIFMQTHILLLPTKADCFGIVFSEASAFGIPSITTNTGGIPSAVEEGINGFLIDVEADSEIFADKIYSVYSDKIAFRNLRISSRKSYEKRLTWKVWTENFNKCIQSINQKKSSRKDD